MPKLYLMFSLSHHQGFPPPTVAAAADLNADDRANEGEFFNLTRDKLTWSGELDFTMPKSVDGLVVMLTFTGALGAKFNVEIRSGGSDGNVVAKVSDIVGKFPELRFVMLKEKS